MTTARNDSWIQIGSENPALAFAIIRELFSDTLARLDAIDVDGQGLVIPAGFISAAMLADAIVTQAKLAAASVGSAQVIDGSLGTADHAPGFLSADAAGRALMADAFVNTAKLGDAQVTTAKIVDANVTAAKLAADAVTTAKILDANVTLAKLAAAVAALLEGAPAVAVGAKVGTTINVSVQLKDAAGANPAAARLATVWLSDSAGAAVTATAPSGAVAIGTNGTIKSQPTPKTDLAVISNATGAFDLDVTEAGAQTWYLNLAVGGRIYSSGALVF